MKTRKMLAILVLALAGGVREAKAETKYVDVDARGANNGSSWVNAHNYLQDALAVAINGDEIRVAQGIYKPDQGGGKTPGDREATFQLINGVILKGGYAGFGEQDPNSRDIDVYKTILSGDLNGDDGPNFTNNDENSYHVVTGSGTDETAILDGFTITGGNSPWNVEGGGMYNSSCSPIVTNCTFGGNSAGAGGGMGNYESNLTLTNCTFRGNRADWGGGGIFNKKSSPTLTNCIFKENSAMGGGGMSNVMYSNPTLLHNTFIGNSAKEGGGIMNNNSTTLTNCTFRGNRADWWGGGMCNLSSATLTNCMFIENLAGDDGGGMYNVNYPPTSGPPSLENPTLTNCTFIGNSAEQDGGGMCNSYYINSMLTNCILWGNSGSYGMNESGQIHSKEGGTTVVNYCCIQGLTGNLGGTGNIGDDPLFVDPNNDDYHFKISSACIDAGTNNPPSGLPETDLDGNPRIINGIVDMGAYEMIIYHVDAINGNDNNKGLSSETAFATIQKGINIAEDGSAVLVYPGIYTESINFKGKAITVKSADYPAVIEAPDDFAVSFYNGEDTNSILKNFVIRNSYMGIFAGGSSPTISNVTIVDNEYGIAAVWADPDISNSIFWNNIHGDLYGCQARYSCIERENGGEGNLDINPQFVDANNGDYHLLSKRGRYWPEHNVWVLDDVISPCIDGGDPTADYSNERKPNGGRINMGAYGGTPYASMKEMRWNPSDINHDDWVNFMDFAKLAENWLTYQPGTSNYPPEAYITKPEDGSLHGRPMPIEIEAYAHDIDGLVEKVEFFANENKIGEDNNGNDGWKTYWEEGPPWSGDYNLTTKATDDDLATTTSPEVKIHVYDLR